MVCVATYRGGLGCKKQHGIHTVEWKIKPGFHNFAATSKPEQLPEGATALFSLSLTLSNVTCKPLDQRYRNELREKCHPFLGKNHSVDTRNGGFWNCLDRDGSRYDTRKYMWLERVGRPGCSANSTEPWKPGRHGWISARNGADFLLEKARNADNRVYFSMTEDEKNRCSYSAKFSAECSWIMALAEFARPSGEQSYR